MATDPALALQGALVAAIKAIPTAAGDNVFDSVPASNPFPRVTVGTGQSLTVEADCYDGTESIVEVNAWSRATGFPEVKGIADLIRDRFHGGALTLAGHKVELLLVESMDFTRDPDGLTSRARIVIRSITQPSP